jgi:hypothetical protein
MANSERSPEQSAVADLRKTLEGKPVNKIAKINLAAVATDGFRVEEITETIADKTATRAFITVDDPKSDNVYRVQIAEKDSQNGKWDLAQGVEDLLKMDLVHRKIYTYGPHVHKKLPLPANFALAATGVF